MPNPSEFALRRTSKPKAGLISVIILADSLGVSNRMIRMKCRTAETLRAALFNCLASGWHRTGGTFLHWSEAASRVSNRDRAAEFGHA